VAYLIPPDNRAVGTGNPPVDMDDVSDVLTGNPHVLYNVANTAFSGGVDLTGATDSTIALQAIIAALPANGGRIYIPANSVIKFSGTLAFKQNQGILGDGADCVTLHYTGSGTAIQALLSGSFTGAAYGGSFSGFYLDGYSAGGSAVGIRHGDLQGTVIKDVAIYGFGGIGLNLQNSAGWSEQLNIQARIVQCGTAGSNTSCAVMLDTSSLDYSNMDFTIVTGNGTGGVYMQNGAQFQGGSLRIRGNFYGAVSNTAAVIALEKAGGSGTAYIKNTLLDVAVESAGSNTGHYTVYLGSSNSASQFLATGVLTFSPVGPAFQGYSNSNNVPFSFSGMLTDPVLGVMLAGDAMAMVGAVDWETNGSLHSHPGGASTIYFQFGDLVEFILNSGNNTLTFQGAPSTVANAYGRRCDLWIAQPNSGAAGTITWPTGTGGVLWANATPPTLSSTNGYVDHVRLTYLPDTNKWYGELVGTHYA
jgi:hypothetical protein